MNILLASIPVACLLVMAPKLAVAKAMKEAKGYYDNNNPRDVQASLQGWGKRAMAAHSNGFESFPPYAAGAIIAYVSGRHTDIAMYLAITYIVVRCIYPVLYIANISTARSLVWGVGFLASLALMALPLF